MRLLAMVCAGLLAATPVLAQEREGLGTGRLFTNDYFGDGDDRWRTGSYVLSHVRGPAWSGERPDGFGQLLEYRLRSEIIAPEELSGPLSTDRPYVGALSFGVHSHYAVAGYDINAGVDLIAVGPQTGLSNLQQSFHDAVSAPSLGAGVIGGQLEDAFYLNGVAEVARVFPVAPEVVVRPFAEATVGPETLARVGADVMFGGTLHNDLWLRDVTTGQLYRGNRSSDLGWGFVAGMDVAQVFDSQYLPAGSGAAAKDVRLRARAGVHYEAADLVGFFYGLTYLSEEYEGQTEGQLLGSVRLDFNW